MLMCISEKFVLQMSYTSPAEIGSSHLASKQSGLGRLSMTIRWYIRALTGRAHIR